MKIITIEEYISGVSINRYLAKYAAEDAPYTAMAQLLPAGEARK